MPSITNKVDDPCQECRDRHLKCDDNRPRCKNCEKLSGSQCTRSGGKLKFRHGSSAKYDTIFGKDQTWLSQSKKTKIQFVDQGPELENQYSYDDADSFKDAARYPDSTSVDLDDATLTRVDTTSTIKTSTNLNHFSPVDRSRTASDIYPRSPSSTADGFRSPLKRPRSPSQQPSSVDGPYSVSTTQRRVDSRPSVFDPIRSKYVLPPYQNTSFQNGMAIPNDYNDLPTGMRVEAEYRYLADTEAAQIPEEHRLTPEVWKKEFSWPNPFTTTQCACLMRYWIERLAPWFDVGDPEKTFTVTVPQRARRCPPLLNAIFTAAARHLASLQSYQNGSGITVYQGIQLPNLKANTAIHYHQACIAYLRKLGEDEVSILDEDLLAAAIILRYYEEFDSGLTGDSIEPRFATFKLFVNAQAVNNSYSDTLSNSLGAPSPNGWALPPLNPSSSAAAHSRPHIMPPSPQSRQQAISQLKTFRHACFRVALRSEVTSSFMGQKPISTALPSTWDLLSLFDTETSHEYNDIPDFVHSDRHLLHCAKVLQYCFGACSPSSPVPTRNSNSASSLEQYDELDQYQRHWESTKPLSFSPIHQFWFQPPAPFQLPQIWHMSDVHTFGLSYLSLASLLLLVYDPSIPRLGPNFRKEQSRVADEVRQIVVKLCGVANSNPESQSAKLQAFVAIAVCATQFVDVRREEQMALFDVVDGLETKWGWRTMKVKADLRYTWGWDRER